MSDPLEDPSGAPYPPSVQAFVDEHLRGLHRPEAGERAREQLMHAIEAAVAVDREHRPPAPEVDDEHASRLVSIYMSGFSSGAATTAIQVGADDTAAQRLGTYLAGRLLEDPAMRLELEQDTTALYTTGEARRPGWTTFAAYPAKPHNPGDQQ